MYLLIKGWPNVRIFQLVGSKEANIFIDTKKKEIKLMRRLVSIQLKHISELNECLQNYLSNDPPIEN